LVDVLGEQEHLSGEPGKIYILRRPKGQSDNGGVTKNNGLDSTVWADVVVDNL
jgi:hypothetical protein